MATSDGMCRHTPHGVAQLPLCLKPPLKRVLGISNRFVILCGGLLSPPKGLERVLEARLQCDNLACPVSWTHSCH